MRENPVKRLGDEEVDGVAGGYIFCSDDINVFPAVKPWEVIDNKGNVVKTFWGTKIDDHRHAKDYASELGFSADDITWYELDDLRRRNQ